ncbi:hypothetical protein V8C44DRAFT_102497 [Trichoderma aethiopicum]
MSKTFRSLRPITQSQQIRNIAELDSTTVSLALPTSVDAKAARFIVTLGATESWPRLRFASRTQIWLPGQKSSYWTIPIMSRVLWAETDHGEELFSARPQDSPLLTPYLNDFSSTCDAAKLIVWS